MDPITMMALAGSLQSNGGGSAFIPGGGNSSGGAADLVSTILSPIKNLIGGLDNSTGQWKTRLAKMKDWTADQRLAWYINEIQTKGRAQDVWQYHEMFGNAADQIHDTGSISYDLAKKFNDMVLSRFGSPNVVLEGNRYTVGDVLLDLGKTVRPVPTSLQMPNTGYTITNPNPLLTSAQQPEQPGSFGQGIDNYKSIVATMQDQLSQQQEANPYQSNGDLSQSLQDVELKYGNQSGNKNLPFIIGAAVILIVMLVLVLKKK